MMAIPLPVSDREFDMMIVLLPDNLDRMQQHDPAEVVKEHLGSPWTEMQIRNIMVAYATQEEGKELIKRVQADPDPAGVWEWLTRGFRYRPEAGDSNEPYTSLHKQ